MSISHGLFTFTPIVFFLKFDGSRIFDPGFHRQISSSFHPPLKYSDTVDKIVPRY